MESLRLYLPDLVAIGWQSSVRLVNGIAEEGLYSRCLRPQIYNVCLRLPYSILPFHVAIGRQIVLQTFVDDCLVTAPRIIL